MTEGTPHEYKEKVGSCAACGNSPVNHFAMYCMQTLDVWATGGEERSALRAAFDHYAGAAANLFEPALYRSVASLPGARFARDPSAAGSYRSQVVWEEAVRRGILMEQLTIFGSHTEIYRAQVKGRWVYFQSLPIPAHLERTRASWLDDKFRLKRALSAAGVPVPRAHSVTSFSDARAALRALGTAAVVKPQTGSRGRHTTVNVRDEADLARAFRIARQLCRYVVIEEYLEGYVCRGTVVDGTLVGFLRADAPRVVGDGVATIAMLVEKANAEKPERVQNIVLTDEHRAFLARRNLTLDTVLPAGIDVPLTHRTGRLFGGRTREMLGREHPKLRAYIERAADLLGASVVGFDLVTPDPEADPDAVHWGIIEANSMPFIDLHYLPLEGQPSNVAAAVWDLWRA